MASIKLAPIISDIAGTVGGGVFSKNANGAYLRTKGLRNNQNTAAQREKRLNLTNFAQQWRNLTQAERDSWTQASPQFTYQNRVGDTKQYTGFQLFVKTNMNLETAALDT